METKDEVIRMRKVNTKVFPFYKALALDYLFFYTIDFLFFTQIKGISASSVILKNAFSSFFGIALQVPAHIIIEFLGRKNSIVLGNILNCLYIVIIMLSRNLGELIFAEFISALAFGLKDVAQPSLLGESIAPSRYKSSIYSRINAKGSSRYHILNAFSKIIAGILFVINPYIPLICSLIVLIVSTILAFMFIEPVKRKKDTYKDISVKKELKDISDGFRFILKSERLKALILYSSVFFALIDVLTSYHVSLLENLKLSSVAIGIIAAVGSLICSLASKQQGFFHGKFRNKSLLTIAFILSVSCFASGMLGIVAKEIRILIIFIILADLIYYFCYGIYDLLIDKYLSNFSNKNIDIKIFSVNTLAVNISGTIAGIAASFLIDRMTTAYCMIIIGILFTVIYFIVGIYMKTRVGLRPEEYDENELKYDQMKLLKKGEMNVKS